MALSGTLTITPTQLTFAGSKCLLSWTSVGAERVFITGLGNRPPIGFEYVYPTIATVYTATFTDYTSTVVSSVAVTTSDDPAANTVSNDMSVLTVDVARNVDAGRIAVNVRRPVGEGTPSYIISSRMDQQIVISFSLLGGDDLGVL
jgi:hypothetical protein